MLRPDATYVYERVDNRIYAREIGSHPSTRQLVGYELTKTGSGGSGNSYRNEIDNMLVMCEQHEDMKELLDKLFVLYNLRRQHVR